MMQSVCIVFVWIFKVQAVDFAKRRTYPNGREYFLPLRDHLSINICEMALVILWLSCYKKLKKHTDNKELWMANWSNIFFPQ